MNQAKEKYLKFDHELVEDMKKGIKTSTWRVYDDKEISVGDEVGVIDKVDPKVKDSWIASGVLHISEVVEKRFKDVTANDQAGHGKALSTHNLVEKFKKYYGSGVDENTPVKIIKFTYHPSPDVKVEPNDDKNTSELTDISEVKLYTDGGSRGNPGPSASAYVIQDLDGNELESGGLYIGITTNNQAEYQALRRGLERLVELGTKKVMVYMDSLLVVNQMKGEYKVKNRDLWPIYESLVELCKKFERVQFNHVPREMNKQADSEVNRILDESR